MRTILRKLFGASIGGGACLSFFVFALTGLISGIPLAARAQDSVTVGTVTFRDKTADTITVVSDVLENTFTLTDPIGTDTTTPEGKFQTGNTMGDATIFSPWYELNATNRRWVATFTASKTVTFTSVTIGGIYAYTANYGGTLSRRPIFTLTVGDVSASSESFATPTSGGERTITFEAPVTLTAGETLTLSCAKASNNSGNFGAGFTSLTFMGPEPTISTETVEWVAGPNPGAASQRAAIEVFGLRLDGLRQLGETVPATVPETAALSSVMVEFLENGSGSANQNVRHLVLTDEAGAVVAVSAEASPVPTAEAAEITFAFPSLPTLTLSVPYKGYFVTAEDVPEVGADFNTENGIKTRVALRADTAATAAGNTAGDLTQYCVAAQFTLQTEVSADEIETVWVMGPPNMGAPDQGKYKEAGICLSAAAGVSEYAPTTLPTSVDLQALTARWDWGQNDGAVTQVRQAVITDAEHTVVAASDVLSAPPAQNDALTVFSFSSPVTLDVAAQYLVYFVNEANADVAVGETFAHETEALEVRLTIYRDAETAGKGFYVTDSPSYVPAFFIELATSSLPEQPLGALNINFDSDSSRLDAETFYGLDGVQYPGSQWNTFSNLPSNSVTTVTDVLDTNGTPMTVSYYSRGAEDYGDAYAPLLRTILLDNIGDGAYVQVEDIPYESYDVYVYMTQNSLPDWRNGSIVVNDTANQFYYMSEDADAAVVAETATRWGGDTTAELQQVTLGQTVMRIAGLSGDRVKLRAIRGANGRGNIAAVQIVELRTEPEPTHWEGTISENVAASALMVSNGTTQKALSELTEADTVELAFSGTVTLTVDAPVTVDTLTLVGAEGAMLVTSGASITAAEIAIEGGTVRTAEGTFVSEAPINLAEGTTLQIQGADGASFTQAVTGAGAVEIYPGSDVTIEADFTHTGGTTVNGVVEGDTQTTTTLRYAGHAVGSVTVGPGGIFDLNGHACAQSITLNGGTLRADEAINETVGAHYVASVDFNNNANSATAIPSDTVAGVLGMRGEYWTVANGSNGNGTLTFYAETAIAGAGAARAAESTLSWDSGATWSASSNWQYLHGYLDDRKNNPGTVTLSIPEVYATHGYTLYLYSNTDTGGEAVFSAREIIGDDGVTTAYTYANGALTTGSTTGWGNINAGRTTVAEGTNLMVIPDLHHRNPVIRLWDRTLNNVRNRGCLAAMQIVANSPNPGNVAGSLSVTGADSKIEIADGLDISFVGSITVSGEGTLSKVGTGTMTLLGAAVTGDFAITEGVAALNEASVSGTITVNGANGLSIGAGAYEEMTVNLPEAATAQAAVESVTIGALTGEGSFDFNGATRLALADAEGAFTGSFLNATDATLVVAGGTFAPTEAQIGQVATLRAEGGTLTLPTTEVPNLEVAGGTVDGPGGGSLADYTEISAGSVTLTAAGTAASARPAMVGADDASVENFSLVEGGTIYYNTPDDRNLYFPEGFIPFRGADAQPYVIVLGEDFADFATFPFSFTVLGADTDASFTLQRPDDNAAPESSYTVDGSAITVWNVGAIIDYSEDLPEARYHYAFDGNLDSTGSETTALTNENAAFVASENGQALSAGSPYVTSLNFSGAWTLGLYLNVAEAAPQVTLLHAGVQTGFTSPGALFLTTGETADEIVLWRRNNGNTDYDALVTADLGLGGANAWHHVLITHTDTRFRVYVDGEMVGEVDGTFANTYTGIQIGKGLGGNSVPDHTNGAGSFQLDDVTIWPAALRDVQIEKALIEKTGAWRIREGETPAELFTANAPWTRTDGSSDVFAATGEDATTLTARATLSVKAGADELFTALQSFTARYVLLEGEPLSYALTDLTAPTLPANIQTLVVGNDLTVDLSAVNLAMASQIAAEPEGYCILPSRWRGALTLTHIPDGFEFDIEARDDGVYLTFVAGGAGSVRALNINFDTNANRLDANTLYGLEGVQYLGSQWNTITGNASANGRSVTDSNGTPMTLSYLGTALLNQNGNTDLLLKAVLQDNVANGPNVHIEGIPYKVYDVYVYMTSDTMDWGNSPVRVNGGDYYIMEAGQDAATIVDGPNGHHWAANEDLRTVALGTTVMRIAGLSGETLTLNTNRSHGSANGRGNIAAVQVVAVAPLYTRTVSGTEAWEATDAWTNVNDGSTVDLPPAGARLMVETTDASILTVDGALPAYDSLTVVGGGTLALSVNGQNLLTDDEYKAIPRGQAHTVTVLDATIDPAQVTAWVSALKYGATATLSATEAGITVAVRLPDAAYENSTETTTQDVGSISFNFTNFRNRDSVGIGDIADDAMGATGTPYETYGAYWLEPTTPSELGQPATETLNAPVVLNSARGAAGADTSKTASLTYNIYHSYANGIAGENQPILAGYANGHSLSGGQGSGGIPYATVNVPEDWDTYTAVIYMSTDSGSPQWLPKRVNGTFYYYEGTTLTTLADTPQATTVGALPDEVKDTTHAWGAPTQDGSLVEGTNMMVIPGLTGDFKLEWWSKPAASGNNVDVTQTQGRVAAFQLIADDAQVPLPNLDAVQVYQAELTGEANWADLPWTINGEAAENVPGAADLVELTLTNDATLTFDATTTVSSITVYGQGHALRVTDAANATAAWTFLNNAILALGEGDVLPETIATNPKRVRYDYAYAANYATTTAYETEFAAGFSGNLSQANGGFVEFSHGDVSITQMNGIAFGTVTGTMVFSGDVRLTMAGDANAAGLKIGNTDVIFRDDAAATLSRIHMRGESATHSSITLEDNAAVTVTGARNETHNANTLQFGDWGGTSALTLRDNARLVAAAADLMLGGSVESAADNGATVTLEDDAEMRVAGVARYNQSSGAIVLNGGSLLVGSRGFRTYSTSIATTSTSVLSVAFNGGALGAWQDGWTWGADTATIVPTVTGDPILETSRNVTLTLAANSNLFATALEATVRGEGTVTSALATLPTLTLESGTFETTVAAQAPSVSLEGGTLALSDVLTVVDGFESHGAGAVRIPVSPSGADGWLAMAEGGLVPNVANVVFTLALDLAGAESLLPYRVPLFMGAYRNNTEASCGFAYSGNVNNAVSSAKPVYTKGSQGQGLYAQLTGNAVVQPHIQTLNATNPGNISQATASVYDYWIFNAETAGGKLTIADGGLGIKDVSFEGLSAVIIASGSEPHTLLQTETLGLGIPVTFDLTAWDTALDAWAAGAVNGVPASLCLASGQVSVETTPTFIGWEAPAGVIVSIEQGERGLYLVATSDRLARTVSVNFSTRANPLSSTPAAPGAYTVPVAAWNDLQGLFSSALLYVSDIGGAATVQATRGEGEAAQPTQVSSSATATVTGTGPSLLQVWLNDTAASTLRVANVPFNSYRLALVFSCDIGDAAFATVTVGSDTYAMDAAGYVRKNVTGLGKVAGDTQWGSTTIDTANYFRQGNNVLLTDVITDASVTVSLPASVYGRLYTGVAAVQVIEAPATETSEEGTDYTYAFTAGDENVNLANLDLTVDGVAGQTWQSGANNTLTLTVPEGLDVTLTLPLNFQADRVRATGLGSLTLQVEQNGGAALNTLNADGLGNLTVHFPCIGVAFEPADGVSRFEAAFDNNGETYTIADGATLALGADSGIAVSLDGGASLDRADGTVTLLVDTDSAGTLRRDYPVTLAFGAMDNAAYSGMTWAFKDVAFSGSGYTYVYVRPNFLIEAGDSWDASSLGIWPNTVGATHTITQTGGEFVFDSGSGDRGFLVGSTNTSVIHSTIDLSGGRMQGKQFFAWAKDSTLDIDVSGSGVLAVSVGSGTSPYIVNNSLAGSFASGGDAASWLNRLTVDFTDGGTLEPLADTLAVVGDPDRTDVTFTGGAIRFGSDTPAEVDMTMSVTFAGTEGAPTTIDPGKFGTLVLDAANTAADTAVLAVPRGTLALADASGLGEATVTVASGAAFEARGFTGARDASEETRTVPVVAIKLDIPAGVGNSDGTAIQEFCLYNGDEKVEWPDGTTISGTGGQNTASNTPNWAAGGNEAINALIDGVTGNSQEGGTWRNPAGGSTGTYTEPAVRNKWYPIANTTGTASATITIGGDGVVFDAYTLWNTDLQARFPSGWTLSVRYEGDDEDTWTVLDEQSGQTRPAVNTESAKYAVALRTEGGATTLDAVTGKVVFAPGAQCRAVRKVGVTGLPYVARIAGSIEVPEGTRYFLDGEEFAAANVTVDKAKGLVTFGAGGPIVLTDVVWDVTKSTGTWADGVGGADGPWVGDATFNDGAGVTFPDAPADIAVTVSGAPRRR